MMIVGVGLLAGFVLMFARAAITSLWSMDGQEPKEKSQVALWLKNGNHLNEIKSGGDRVGRFDVGLTQEGSALD